MRRKQKQNHLYRNKNKIFLFGECIKLKQQQQHIILTRLVVKRQKQSLMSSFLLPLNLVDCEKSAKTFAKIRTRQEDRK